MLTEHINTDPTAYTTHRVIADKLSKLAAEDLKTVVKERHTPGCVEEPEQGAVLS